MKDYHGSIAAAAAAVCDALSYIAQLNLFTTTFFLNDPINHEGMKHEQT